MKGPRNAKARSEIQAPRSELPVKAWFVGSDAEMIARRNEVWSLLRWYHHRYVLPNMGLAGFLRRLYIRIVGQRLGGRKLLGITFGGVNLEYLALVSPWEHWEAKRRLKEAFAQLEACPIGFLPAGETEPLRCELQAGHPGKHVAGSLEWADDEAPPSPTPAPPGPRIEA